MRFTSTSSRVLAGSIGALCLATAIPAHAAIQTYSSTPTVWDLTTQNWDGGTDAWLNGNDALFNGTAGTVDLDAALSAVNLTYGVTGYTFADTNGTPGSLAVSGTITLPASGTETITAPLTGTGFTVTKTTGSGTGILDLSGANNFSGTISIVPSTTGTVQLRLAGTSGDIIPDSVVIDIGGVAGSATFTLNGHSETIGGLTTLQTAGTKRITNASGTSATLTLNVAANTLKTYGGQVGTTAATSQNANNYGVTKSGAGAQIFTSTAVQTATQAAGVGYFGDTVISDGALGFAPIAQGTLVNEVGPTSSLVRLDGGVIANTAAGNFTRSFGSTAGAYLSVNTNFQMTTNGGGFAARGGVFTVNLGGAGATVNWGDTAGSNLAGTLVLSNSGANSEVSFQNAIALNGARTVLVADNPVVTTDFATLAGALQDGTGAGSLTKTGGGPLVLSAVNTYTGATTIGSAAAAGGNLVVNGSLAGPVNVLKGVLNGVGGTVSGATTVGDGLGTLDALLSPGAAAGGIGTLNAANVTFNGLDGVFGLEINSTTTTTDLLNSTGAVTLNLAALSIADLGSATLSGSQVFTFITAGSVVGTFANLPNGSTVAAGLNSYTISYTPTTVLLTAVPEPAAAGYALGGLALLAGSFRRRKV